MTPELQDELYEKYPKIFGQKDLSPKETAMCWGIECGDGWYMLIDQLCKHLQFHTDHNNKSWNGEPLPYPQVEAVQVKEKWGGLRFYTNGHSDKQEGAISFAEKMSYHICEECGSTDEVDLTIVTGWYRSLCKTCRGEFPLATDKKKEK